MIKERLTPEQESFVRDNYRTMNNVEIGNFIDRHPKVVIRVMRRLGITRTDAEKLALVNRALKSVDSKSRSRKIMKIEGGSVGSYRRKYHLAKWTELNGPVRKGNILVYRTGNFDSFDDLMVIQRSKFATFVRVRDRKKQQGERRAEKQKQQASKKPRRVKSAPTPEATLRKRVDAEAKEKFEEFKRNYKPKTPAQAQEELAEQGKVPVKLDHKTTIWVKRDKCVRLENGSWVKKESLNNHENIHGNKNERTIAGAAEGVKRLSDAESEPQNEIHRGTAEEREEVGGGTDLREFSHY